MTRRLSLLALSLAVFAFPALPGCSKTDSAPPVATVSVTPSKTRVTLGSPIDLTYTFTVAPTAKINGDYKVFLHVMSDDGQKVWDDDHDPAISTTEWKPGQTIQYTRTKFVPEFPYIGKATMEVGLYKGDERLPLVGADPNDRTSTTRAYKVGTLELLPSSDNVFVITESGWNQPEYAPNDASTEWRWTQKTAAIGFHNPTKDVTFYLETDARPDLFPTPQQVTLSSGNQVVTTFAAVNKTPELRRIPISAAQLGTGDMAELRLEVDRTFVPARLPNGGQDQRELGIRVYHMFVEPK